jgi:hypothetical protein
MWASLIAMSSRHPNPSALTFIHFEAVWVLQPLNHSRKSVGVLAFEAFPLAPVAEGSASRANRFTGYNQLPSIERGLGDLARFSRGTSRCSPLFKERFDSHN